MKIRYNLMLVILLIVSSVLLTSCKKQTGTNAAIANIKPGIDLEVNTETGSLDIWTPPNGNCSGNGCIVVPHNNKATVTFKLHGSGTWHFTEFQICAGGTKPDDCGLTDEQREEFEVFNNTGDPRTQPSSEGLVNIGSLSNDPIRSFKLKDKNTFEQDYFYIIKACSGTGGSNCVDTDPPIENKGKL